MRISFAAWLGVGSALVVLLGALGCGDEAMLFGGDPPDAPGGAGAGGTTAAGGHATTGSTGGTTTTSAGGSSTTSTSGDGGEGGAVLCPPPFDECDGVIPPLCETNTDSSSEHCGGCHQPCATECVGGTCSSGCDANLAIDEDSPQLVLRAIGLCGGVVAASWVQADGTPAPASASYHLGHGVLPSFGPNVHPQEGTRMLALSTGTARQPTDPGYQAPDGYDKVLQCAHPTGFPVASPSCPGVVPGDAHDPIGLEVTVAAPADAGGFAIKHKFYTFEWSDYVCSEFADLFALLRVAPPPSSPTGNTIFDSLGNPMGAHNSFVDVCGCTNGPPCTAQNLTYACTLGTAELTGTGFETHAATGWLETRVPVAGGTTFTIRFVAYDSGDAILDSTVLLDDWQWIDSPGTTPVTSVVVDPD